MPQACISAYAVVGPTKRKPRPFSSRASAVDSGVVDGRSAGCRGARRRFGANDQIRCDSESSAAIRLVAARAFAIAASTFARLRTIPESASSRRTSASSNAATASISKFANARRNASRLRRIVSQESPD